MEGNPTPWGRRARPGKGAGGPRRRCRPTSLPCGPPGPCAASPSATPSAWRRWPWWSGSILWRGSAHCVCCCVAVCSHTVVAPNCRPQTLRYFHPARHFRQLCGHGRHEAVPRRRLQRHQSQAGESPAGRCCVHLTSGDLLAAIERWERATWRHFSHRMAEISSAECHGVYTIDPVLASCNCTG